MARDEKARDKQTEASLLNRRGYLKATGAALMGTTIGAGVATKSARAASSVGANWEIRNRYIETGSNQLGIGCAVTDSDGEGVIEHVYIRSTGNSDKPAIWVDPNQHVGHLTIKNVHIEGHADNAIYGETAPPHGAGGTVTIEDCYLHDNTRGNLRINGGTEVRNTHIHNTGNNFPDRGYLTAGYYSWYEGGGEITMRNCQIKVDGSGAQSGSTAVALKTWGSTGAYGDYGDNIPEVNVYDSQVKGPINGTNGNINLHNTGSTPTINPPKGVPMTADEAQNGTSSATGPTWSEVSDGTVESGSDTDSSGNDQQGTVLELVAGADTQSISYEFTVDGAVAKHTVSGDIATEGNDEIADNGDGTVTVTGVSGNGYGDAYMVDGAITAMQLDDSKWTLRYGGQQTSVADLTDSSSDVDASSTTETASDSTSGDSDLPNTLVLDGTDTPNEVCTYQFTVSGSAAKSDALGSINAYDEVSGDTISGRVIGGTDAYRFSGEITDFTVSGSVAVRLDSQS